MVDRDPEDRRWVDGRHGVVAKDEKRMVDRDLEERRGVDGGQRS